MKTVEQIRDFLDPFVSWASRQPDVQGVALVGSYARGEARDDSDIDLVILTDQPQKYLAEIQWTKRFGIVEKRQSEDYGKLISLRIWYQNGPEVEYGITTPAWAAIPWMQGHVRSFQTDDCVVRARECIEQAHRNMNHVVLKE